MDQGTAEFRKLATKVDRQGKGYGSQLLSYLMEYAAQQNISKILCNARIDKTCFYQKFGMTKTVKTFCKGGLNYVIMEKNIEIL